MIRIDWYNHWHKHPRHQHAHWLILFSILFISSILISADLLDSNLNSVYAQTGSISGYYSPDPQGIGPGVVLDYETIPDTLCIDGDGISGAIIRRDAADIFLIRSTDPDLPNGTRVDYTYPGSGTYTYTLHDAGCGVTSQQVELGRVVITVPLTPTPLPTPTPGSLPTPTPGSLPTPTPGSLPTPTPEPIEPPTSTGSCDLEVPYPTPVLCDFYPTIARLGDIINANGLNLTDAITLNDLGEGSSTISITGTVFKSGNSVNFIIPAGTPLGDYTVSILGIDGINKATNSQILKIVSTLPVYGNPSVQPFSDIISSLVLPSATNFKDLISGAYNYSIILVGIAVFLVMLWAGFLWMTSGANPGNISTAKRYMTNAFLGAILLLSSYAILYTINPELAGSKFILKAIPTSTSGATGLTTRLIATSEVGAASAVTAGCIIATEIRDFTAVECLSDAASLTGLPLDPSIELTDINANQQVNASIIQSAGNIGNGRKIVILDTGYNRNHPELSSSYGGGWDFVNKDNDPNDDHTSGVGAPGHGSHVAGIITGDGIDSRSKGVAPGVKIIAGKVLDGQGKGYWSSLVEAIYWAVNGPDNVYGTSDDFGADAINISMGGTVYNNICDNADETTKLLLRAIQYARNHGVLSIIAAGNNSSGVAIPGCISEAFTVGAVNSSDAIAGFSGRGPSVDVVAPGVNIYSALLGNSYGIKSGTSMATPIVSGIAALIKVVHPDYGPSELEQAIISTAKDLGSVGKDNTFGWGRVTANAASPGGIPIPPPSPLPGPTPVTPPTQQCYGSTCGKIWASIASCTKGLNPSNPSCNFSIGFQGINLSVPTQLIVKANGIELQRITCQQSSCSGIYSYNNPGANYYQLTLNLPSGNTIGTSFVYIYSSGTMNSNFNTCLLGSAANPKCNVVLTINAPSIYPYPILIKKDGYNWRQISCSSPSCNETVNDLSPNLGIHTYTLHNSSDESRLDRTTVTILDPTVAPPPSSSYIATLCTDINYGGICEIFNTGDMDLSNNTVGNDNVSSIRGYATICTDIGLGGICETFMDGDPDLRDNFIGNDTVSSIRRGLAGGTRLILCSDINFAGSCEVITLSGDDPSLIDNPIIGNDTVSSMRVETTDITACTDINFGGICELFREGIYPDLRYHPLGNDTMSSYRD